MAFVVPDDTSEILTVPEVEAVIGPADVAVVQRHINAATKHVEDHIGPVLPRTVTEKITTNGATVLKAHVVSITSLLRGDRPVPAADYELDAEAGLLTGYLAGATVTYMAGFDPIPEPIRQAVLYTVQHAHESEQGAVVNGQGAGDEVFTLSRGFYLPNRAKELLAPYRLGYQP